MGLFNNNSKMVRKELEGIAKRIMTSYQNKDTDATRAAFLEYKNAVAAAKASGSLDEDYIEKYESSIAMYKLTVKCLRDL